MAEQPVGYRKTYKMRKLMPNRKYIVAGIPYEVIEREATIRGLTVDEFIDKFEVVAEYDNSNEVRQTFKEKQGNGNNA